MFARFKIQAERHTGESSLKYGLYERGSIFFCWINCGYFSSKDSALKEKERLSEPVLYF